MATNPAVHDDPDDLEALFDSILEANNTENNLIPEAKPAEVKATVVSISTALPDTPSNDGKVIAQIGQMARSLHDSLRELGLNKEIERAAVAIPDARDRLNYVANLTLQAAERVLNATEAAQPVVDKIEDEARRLSRQWELLFEKKLDVAGFKNLVLETQAYLNQVPKQTKQTNAYLMEIMMAQDFQDLTGQVIKKVILATQELEQKLLTLLVDNAPTALNIEVPSGLLNGPVINAKGRNDVVTSQDQVDDLLSSLGF